jgi:hypothetical protein
LFALAVDDAKQASVTKIQDAAYNDGQPIPCNCFETGEQWHYVWTRDLAYALDLGLADLDPTRAVDSLLFKTSSLRGGISVPAELAQAPTQIVQDTGSGGSWPISTDRTTWALGAERTLANLTGEQRSSFERKALEALRGTLEADRLAAYDPRDGLYGGEHSFLDWREQTYAPWIVNNLSAMARMKALSTNIVQFRAMQLAARLARTQRMDELADRYESWSDALKAAINARFWDDEAGMYATYLSADPDPRSVRKYDLLGNDLAILSGIVDQATARRILSRYPFAPFGPPVVWPQAPGEFVYHNRAQWPFVTAYTLRAAAQVGHVAAADRSIDALMRASTLHLSNMENLEWLTGLSHFDDGPAINSRRQLWSVGGYFGAVTSTIFGWQPKFDGVSIAPFLTSHTRRLFGPTDIARLSQLQYSGRRVDVVLKLPRATKEGAFYPVRSITLNGRAAPDRLHAVDLDEPVNEIVVTFGSPRRATDRVTLVPPIPVTSHDDPRAFMPRTPVASAEAASGVRRITIADLPQSAEVTYDVLRDGKTVARDSGPGVWTDQQHDGRLTHCYSIVARFRTTHLESQPSEGVCFRGAAAQTIPVGDPRVGAEGRAIQQLEGVAVPTLKIGLGQKLTVRDIDVSKAGTYAISFLYDNHVGPLNTGISNAVKRLTLDDGAGQVQRAVVQMPHINPEGSIHPVRLSTRAYLTLRPGRYKLQLGDFINMSALASNATYRDQGGTTGPVNEAQVAEIQIDRIN